MFLLQLLIIASLLGQPAPVDPATRVDHRHVCWGPSVCGNPLIGA